MQLSHDVDKVKEIDYPNPNPMPFGVQKCKEFHLNLQFIRLL
jgi:hypothetical protein